MKTYKNQDASAKPSRQVSRFRKKNGFNPYLERCGDCDRAKGLHRPDGFAHEFVPTGRKAPDVWSSKGIQKILA